MRHVVLATLFTICCSGCFHSRARGSGRRGDGPHAAAQRLRRQGARRLGRPDDRRLVRRAHRVPLECQDPRGITSEVAAEPRRQRDRSGRPLRGNDVRGGDGSSGTRRDERAVRRGLPHVTLQPVARQRRGAAAPESGHQGAALRQTRSTTRTPTTSTSRSSRTSSA